MRCAPALVTALLVAGCGGGDREPLSKTDYQSAMLAAWPQEASSMWDRMVVEELPQPECESLIRRFHAVVDTGVERVASLEPPTEVARAHARLVVAARASVAEVGRVARRVEDGAVKCGPGINRALYGMPSTDDAESALDEIERAGIPLGRQ